jgi:hypothetical protein
MFDAKCTMRGGKKSQQILKKNCHKISAGGVFNLDSGKNRDH